MDRAGATGSPEGMVVEMAGLQVKNKCYSIAYSCYFMCANDMLCFQCA
jgi:hypothetical protein